MANAITEDKGNVARTETSQVFGILLKSLSAMVFSFMVAVVKLLSETIPTGEIVFARSFFGIFPVLIMIAMSGRLSAAVKTTRPMMHLKRAVFGVGAMYLWFTCLKFLQLPDATAIGYTMPLITLVLAFFILKETVRIYRWSAVLVGFTGILVILLPNLGISGTGTNDQLIGSFFAFASTVLMAFALIYVRQMTKFERTSTIVFWFSVSSTVFALFSIPFGWIMPTLEEAILLVFVGVSGGVGQILVTQSYRYADASTLAPFDYTTMIWAILLGWFLFAELPSWQVLVGSAIVIASGLFVIYREHKLEINRAKAQRVTPTVGVG